MTSIGVLCVVYPAGRSASLTFSEKRHPPCQNPRQPGIKNVGRHNECCDGLLFPPEQFQNILGSDFFNIFLTTTLVVISIGRSLIRWNLSEPACSKFGTSPSIDQKSPKKNPRCRTTFGSFIWYTEAVKEEITCLPRRPTTGSRHCGRAFLRPPCHDPHPVTPTNPYT